ncbi:hypothetical protein C0058_25325 [Pseudomonas sp. NC02]|nr:hypothetical protein C0058_25325 [Pseudomonas sp. NC02]
MWECFCGSWLACDADASVFQMHRGDAIAGKPGSHTSPLPNFVLCSQGRILEGLNYAYRRCTGRQRPSAPW